ncbi:hypothetical protein IAD21_03739 [Abditibacteriota bacterium]|nr:hypothetical protein IAD21_03739 [Abditibacteriota bacterium]
MKQTIGLALLLLVGSSCFAKNAFWHPDQKPQMSLTQALALAQKALGKKQRNFYCLDASIAKIRSQGDWTLTFGSKNMGMRYIMVSFDKTVRVSTSMFSY